MLVTFEGPNGAGKTTISTGVADRLRTMGFDVLLTKEPTKSSLGEFFRNAEEKYRGDCLAHIAAADRCYHIESEIKPALAAGKIVLSDRYVESSLVLQGLDGCSMDFVWGLNSRVIIPDFSVILSAFPITLSERMQERQSLSRFEREKSREQEVELYLEAAVFLQQKGFYMLHLENDHAAPEDNIDWVVEEIQKWQQTKDRLASR